MKRGISIVIGIVLVALLLATASGCSIGSSGENSDVIKIGAIYSASGGAAPLGKPEWDTVKMLTKEINDNGGIDGKKIELIMYDDKSDQNEAVLSMKKLIEQDKVTAIVGGTISGNTLAMIPLAQKSEIVFISNAASKEINKPSDGSSRKWIFKTAQGDDVVIPRILQYLKDQGLTKVAWLNVANAYGTGGHNEFKALAPEYGVDAVIEEEFEATVNDAKAMLTRVKNADPQAIIIWGTVQESAVVTKNIRQLDIDLPIIESHGIGTQQFIELAGDSAEGVVFPAGGLLVADQLPDDHPQKQVLLDYQKDYEEAYGAQASTFGGHAWDSYHILINALKEVGTDSEKLREYIENETSGFVGISGVFNMSADDHNGLAADALVMLEIKDGKWVLKEE